MDIRVEKTTPDLLKTKPDENSLGFGQHMADHMFVMLYDESMGWHDAVIKPYENFSLSPAAMLFDLTNASLRAACRASCPPDPLR